MIRFRNLMGTSPCRGWLEYLHRSPCEPKEATKGEHSLRWDGNAWLLVLSDWTVSYRPVLPSERAPYKNNHKAIVTKEKDKDKFWSWAPKGSPIPRGTGRLTVGRTTNSTELLGTKRVSYSSGFWIMSWLVTSLCLVYPENINHFPSAVNPVMPSFTNGSGKVPLRLLSFLNQWLLNYWDHAKWLGRLESGN
jgi:hypothetical protein